MIHSDNRSVRGREVINYRQVEKKILDEILGKKVYDTRLRPPGHNNSVSGGDDMSATLVHVNIFVRKRCSGNKLYLNPKKYQTFESKNLDRNVFNENGLTLFPMSCSDSENKPCYK